MKLVLAAKRKYGKKLANPPAAIAGLKAIAVVKIIQTDNQK